MSLEFQVLRAELKAEILALHERIGRLEVLNDFYRQTRPDVFSFCIDEPEEPKTDQYQRWEHAYQKYAYPDGTVGDWYG